jgi:hypothetical protein
MVSLGYSQKVFFGGGSGSQIPVGNYLDYEYQHSIFGGHTGQIQEVISSNDETFLYFQSQDAQTLKNYIYKVNANTEEYLSNFTAKSYSRNLQISENDSFLFFNSSFMLYKADALTMTLVDSMVLTSNVANILVYDENTVFCNSLNYTFKADFISHSFVDSVVNYGNERMTFNSTKTKIYSLRGTPSELNRIRINPLAQDTIIALNMNGTLEDVIINTNYIIIKSRGGNGQDGTLQILDTLNLQIASDIALPSGTGFMSISPNDYVWVPCSYSQKIAVINLSTFETDTVLSTLDINNLTSCYSVAFSNFVLTDIKPIPLSQSIKIYPNPTSGVLNVSGPMIQRINVLNNLGQIIYTSTSSEIHTFLDQPPGLYVIETFTNHQDPIRTSLIIH